MVLEVDACGREVRRGTFLPSGAVRGIANDVVVAAPYLYVVGFQAPAVSAGDRGEGFAARLFQASLGLDVVIPLRGSDLNDAVNAVAVAPDGALWGVGVLNYTAGPPWATHCAWTIKADGATGAACGSNPFANCTYDGINDIQASATTGRLHVAGRRGSDAFTTSYAPSECSTVAPCPCTPSGRTVLFRPPGATAAEAYKLAVGSTATYAIGWADASGAGDYAGTLVRIPASGGVPSFAPLWNPTPLGDAFLGLTLDSAAGSLFIVGVSNWDVSPTSTTASAVVARYDAATLAGGWTAYPPLAGACWDVLLDAAGGLVIACVSPTSSSVRRCLPAGTCP